MSTAQLTHPVPSRPGASLGVGHAGGSVRASVAPLALSGALVLLLLYAGFAHGAIIPSTEARVQVALAAMAALAGGAWLWQGSLRLSAPRPAVAGIALLTTFAVWSGITVLWSVAPDQTWIELNRAISYVIVICLAVAVGASHRRSVEFVAGGFLLVSLVVSLYGLGQKLLPGLHVPGIINLNQTGPLPRLQEPLGYWNALALFIAMGTPIALALAVDRERPRRVRLAALAAVEVMLLTIGFTYSRGGVLALALAIAAGIAVSGARLRSLLWLATACAASLPPLILGLNSHSLTAVGVGIGPRERAGLLLTAVLVVSLLGLLEGGRRLLDLEARVVITPDRAHRIGSRLAASAGALLAAGVLAVAVSPQGLDGTVSHAWKTFTATRGTSIYDPHRLLSADSENRWVWWKEAAGAFSDRPVQGWGAGSFAVVHLLYRRDNLTVKQPHSVPLQWLTETGLIGALLAIAGYGLLLVVGTRAVRSRPSGSGRLLAAALLAGAAAYAIHACYDWDWDIPGVTLPALLMLGVLAGSLRRDPPEPALPRRGPVSRLLAVAALTFWLCTFAISAALPSIAASDASKALVTAAGSSSHALLRAQVSALLATKLDPLSDAGLRAQAAVAEHLHRPLLERADLLAAVRRNPTDAQAWSSLAYLEAALSHPRAAILAAQRVLALNLHGVGSAPATLAQLMNLLEAPPQASATSKPLPRR